MPTSAGAHNGAQDLAPAALRGRGLINRMQKAGLVVSDGGDVAGEQWAPAVLDSSARNLAAVLRVATAVSEAVTRECGGGRIPIVLGGDCTITLGVVAGVQLRDADVQVAYFDGDADLNSPERTRSGILDAMAVAHLLGIAETPLARLGAKTPMRSTPAIFHWPTSPTTEQAFHCARLDRFWKHLSQYRPWRLWC